MSKTKVVPLRIPVNLDEIAALSAMEEHTDKATALRQWLHEGAAHYVVKLVREGRISRGRATELLGITYYDFYGLAERYGVELGLTLEQHLQSRSVVEKLLAGIEKQSTVSDQPA